MITQTPEGYPSRYESRLTLKSGREVFLRPILPTEHDHPKDPLEARL